MTARPPANDGGQIISTIVLVLHIAPISDHYDDDDRRGHVYASIYSRLRDWAATSVPAAEPRSCRVDIIIKDARVVR